MFSILLGAVLPFINIQMPTVKSSVRPSDADMMAKLATPQPIGVYESDNHKLQIHFDTPQSTQNFFKQISLYLSAEDPNCFETFQEGALTTLIPGDCILSGLSREKIDTLSLCLGKGEFAHFTSEGRLLDIEFSNQISTGPCTLIYRNFSTTLSPNKETEAIQIEAHTQTPPLPTIAGYDFYFVNKEKLPLVLSPNEPNISFSSFRDWIQQNQTTLKNLIAEHGALLLRGFPVKEAEEFRSVITTALGQEPMNYRGGEGSRHLVTDGIYTSTEAPPGFQIPLHNELSCTNHPPTYISFYCLIAPKPGSGQTILGSTERVSKELLLKYPDVWTLFYGQNLNYISRHPPEGSFFTKVNRTHKPWQKAFETTDPLEVEKICKEKGFTYTWLGDWIEVVRRVPAIRTQDQYFNFDYWYNQAHLYHSNPRIRGGWLTHILANLLYIVPSTRQYDIEFENGESIPQDIIYHAYDVLEDSIVKFDWKEEDVLIVHNIKSLHGRAKYKGERRVLVGMTP